MSAYVVFRESGEYSDHWFMVLCVAKTEAEARAAVEHHAKAKTQLSDWREPRDYIARPMVAEDDKYEDGWWVAIDAETARPADPYNSVVYGFQAVAAWGES